MTSTTVPLSAIPMNGYEFLNWTGQGIEDSNSSDTNLVLSESQTVTANFQKRSFHLKVEQKPEGNVTGSGYYEYGTDANITATPSEGYTFTKWVGSGIADYGAQVTTISITQDINISADFAINSHMLSVNTESGGTVRGSGVFNYGSSVSISAIPFDNYEFVRWEIKNENYSNFQFKTVEVTSDMNITAVFAKP